MSDQTAPGRSTGSVVRAAARRFTLLLVGIAVAGVMQSDTAYNIFSLLTGALIGPAVGLWLGWHLGRPATSGPIAETAPVAL